MSTIRRLGVLTLACLLLTTACGGSDGSGTESADGDNAQGLDLDLVNTTKKAAQPTDEIKWMLSTEPASLDADRAGGQTEDTVIANICERLFQMQPDFSLKPWLAERVKRTNPRTFVYTIRGDVTFHDGSTLTAEDVVWSLRRHAKPGHDESDEFLNVASIKQTGSMEVTVTLKSPDAQFSLRMAGDGGIVYNKKYVKQRGENYGTPGSGDACTGPYTVAQWDAGSRIVLERYDGYWNEKRAGLAKTITFSWGGPTAIANSLGTGAVDGTYLQDPSLVAPLQSNDQLGVYFGPATTASKLFATGSGPAGDPLIRKAISLALDRKGIVKAGFQGIGRPWKAPVGPGTWGYARDKFTSAYEEIEGVPAEPTDATLQKAKDLVRKAGKPAEPLVVASDGSPLRNVIANAVRDAGKRIGLKVKIETLSEAAYDELFSSKQARAKVDFFSTDWYLSKPDPLGWYDNLLSNSVNNYVGYDNPRYDKLYKKASGTYGDGQRAELVLELQDMFFEDMLVIPMAFSPNALVLKHDLTGAPVSMAYLTYPWAADIGRRG